MKIGLLTYHCVPNFGAQLQTLSTIGFLRSKGFNVVVLNWYPKDLEEMYTERIPLKQIDCHNLFCKQNFPLSRKINRFDYFISEINNLELDGIIIGSDALFKFIPIKTRRHFCIKKLKFFYSFEPLSCELLDNNPFFGSFIKFLKKKIPVVGYAISSQNCPYKQMSREERRKMAKYLSNYKFISVRDNWTKNMVETVLGNKNICVFPDPVFSFNQNCYLPIPTKEEICTLFDIKSDYILLSFSNWYCNTDYISSIETEVKKHKLLPIALPMPEQSEVSSIEKKIFLPLNPLLWYALIIHSNGYIGERMHPIVVCLHNIIPFFSFDEYGIFSKKHFFSKEKCFDLSSSKTYSIVKDANLENYLYSYNSGLPLPTPEFILNRILHFDKSTCSNFAQRKKEEYLSGMNRTISYFYEEK